MRAEEEDANSPELHPKITIKIANPIFFTVFSTTLSRSKPEARIILCKLPTFDFRQILEEEVPERQILSWIYKKNGIRKGVEKSPPQSFTPLDHRILKQLKEFNQKSLLLAISGGLDSMVLLETLHKLKPALSLHLVVAYVHHGPSENRFRDQAQSHVLSIAQTKGLKSVTNPPDEVSCGPSEAEMREFRYHHLESWANKMGLVIVTAHHSDDLLETQLLRLIRGVGPQGLPSMIPADGKIFRPLLEFTRCELEAYAKENKISFLEDPSNENRDYLRNWLRKDWLPLLEKKSPGSLKTLARSLSHLSQNLGLPQLSSHCLSGDLDLRSMLPLTRSQKSSVIAQFMRHKGLKNYGQTHIDEALKRFDRTPSGSFYLLQHQWTIDRGRVSIKPKPSLGQRA